jgi:UDP-3-O-[3-hydroxymyristoyl] glucosamine N-acyltransferase
VTLADLAAAVGCPFEGDGSLNLVRVATIEQAGPGDLTFLANRKYARALGRTRASAVIAAPDVAESPCAVLRSAEPYVTFARAAALLMPAARPPAGVHPLAAVDATAAVAPSASIGPFAVVAARASVGDRTIVHPHVVVGAGTVVGADCILHAHVSIREGCRLGDRVVVQNGAVIGSDGFGFATRADGTHVKIPQVGPVVIEDDVEIGANTTIDRPAVGETRIKAGTKIDNLVQIGHGVVLGRNVLMAAQSGIAGSTSVGDSVQFGGQSGAAGHLTIGDRVKIAARAAVFASVDADAFVSGTPAIDHREWRKASAVFAKLPELRQRLLALEARLNRSPKIESSE